MVKTLQNENKRHAEAYSYYLQLGSERSYAKVGEKFGVSEVSVQKWSKSFNWQKRVKLADLKSNKATVKATEMVYVEDVKMFRSAKYKLVYNLIQKLGDSSTTVNELSVIYKILKIELRESLTPEEEKVPNDTQLQMLNAAVILSKYAEKT